MEELRVTIRNGIEARHLRREVEQVRKERAREFNFRQIVGESPVMKKMLALAAKVAESEVSSVLLQGESGTGKDLVAKAIHYGSQRAESPFIAINCAALPATLIESELFGYEKGAFTDAKARKEEVREEHHKTLYEPEGAKGDPQNQLNQHDIPSCSLVKFWGLLISSKYIVGVCERHY